MVFSPSLFISPGQRPQEPMEDAIGAHENSRDLAVVSNTVMAIPKLAQSV